MSLIHVKLLKSKYEGIVMYLRSMVNMVLRILSSFSEGFSAKKFATVFKIKQNSIAIVS